MTADIGFPNAGCRHIRPQPATHAHSMSTRMRGSRNSIWVSGFGIPAPTNSSRTLVSCGDSAPPSASCRTARSCRTPRAPGVPIGDEADVGGLGTCRVEQGVEDRDRTGDRSGATDAETRSGCCRHGHSRDHVHLAVGQRVAVDHDAGLAMPVAAHDLCGRGAVAPFPAVHRRDGQDRQGAPVDSHAARLYRRRQPRFLENVHVAEHRPVSGAQLAPGNRAPPERRAAKEWLHAVPAFSPPYVCQVCAECGPWERISRWGRTYRSALWRHEKPGLQCADRAFS